MNASLRRKLILCKLGTVISTHSPSPSNANATGDIGGASLTATQNRLYDVSMLNIQTMTVPQTNVSYGMRTTTGRSVHGTETEFSLAAVSNKISVISV